MADIRLSPSGRDVSVATTEESLVADLATLALVPSESGADLVWVDSLLCYFHRNRFSTVASDGITVIPAIGGGNWERIVSSTSTEFLHRREWYLSDAGDDENAGTALQPLRTFEELTRRLSVGELQDSVDVVVLTEYWSPYVIPDTTPSLKVRTARRSTLTEFYAFRLRGATTVVHSDVVAAYTPPDHATPESATLSAVGIVDWTVFVDKRIRITSGAAAGAVMWWARVATGSPGDVVVVSPCSIPGLAPGDTFVIEFLVGIENLSLEIEGSSGLGNDSHIEDIMLISGRVNGGGSDRGVRFINSLVGGDITVSPGKHLFVNGCFIERLASEVEESFLNWCYVWEYHQNGGVLRVNDSLCGEGGIPSPIVLGYGSQALFQSNVQIFDCVKAFDFGIGGSGSVRFGSDVSGVTMGDAGVHIDNFTQSTGAEVRFDSATPPNLAGAVAEIRVSVGGQDIDLAWASVNFKSDEQSGVATLVAGTVIVPARFADVRGVTISRRDGSGVLGHLSVPVATRGPAQFVIESTDIGDTSTVDWHIPGFSWPVDICPIQSNEPGT